MDSQNQSDNPFQDQLSGQANHPTDQSVRGDSSDNPGEGTTDDSSVSQDDSMHTDVPLPPEAGDSDLIEKEWVDRAKQIVDHTREDPYEQQRALSQMKADYLKKRYDKDIKISED